MIGPGWIMASARSAILRALLPGACLLFVGCMVRPKLGPVTDVAITAITVHQYEDPSFQPCKDFEPSIREITRFLTTATVMQPGETDDGDSGEPCEATGTARIGGVKARWRMNRFGIGGATTSPYQYYPLAMGGQRGVRRARSRLLALFGPDHFNPPPRENPSLDTRLRNRAASAGLPDLQEGEVRVWWSSVNQVLGVSARDGELIEHVFAYRVDVANEKHGQSVWVRSSLPPETLEAIRKGAAAVADLHGREIDCAQVLDGSTVQIEAMVNSTRILVQAEEPDEHTSDACRRVWVLEQLLWDAASQQRPTR